MNAISKRECSGKTIFVSDAYSPIVMELTGRKQQVVQQFFTDSSFVSLSELVLPLSPHDEAQHIVEQQISFAKICAKESLNSH
jgi:hypothetical protein